MDVEIVAFLLPRNVGSYAIYITCICTVRESLRARPRYYANSVWWYADGRISETLRRCGDAKWCYRRRTKTSNKNGTRDVRVYVLNTYRNCSAVANGERDRFRRDLTSAGVFDRAEKHFFNTRARVRIRTAYDSSTSPFLHTCIGSSNSSSSNCSTTYAVYDAREEPHEVNR